MKKNKLSQFIFIVFCLLIISIKKINSFDYAKKLFNQALYQVKKGYGWLTKKPSNEMKKEPIRFDDKKISEEEFENKTFDKAEEKVLIEESNLIKNNNDKDSLFNNDIDITIDNIKNDFSLNANLEDKGIEKLESGDILDSKKKTVIKKHINSNIKMMIIEKIKNNVLYSQKNKNLSQEEKDVLSRKIDTYLKNENTDNKINNLKKKLANELKRTMRNEIKVEKNKKNRNFSVKQPLENVDKTHDTEIAAKELMLEPTFFSSVSSSIIPVDNEKINKENNLHIEQLIIHDRGKTLQDKKKKILSGN